MSPPVSPHEVSAPSSARSASESRRPVPLARRVRDALFSVFAYRLLRWLLAGVFIGAGSLKLADPVSFAVIVDAFGILPPGLLMPAAILLPLLEVIAGIGLIFDLRGSLATLAGLLALFLLVLGYGLHMGLDVDCGCFGPHDPEGAAYASIRPAFYRDLAMAAGVVYLYLWRWVRDRSPRPLRPFVFKWLQRKESVSP
jgi:uncharacterized membrane protein YphA (DoxX/SURF4 family)